MNTIKIAAIGLILINVIVSYIGIRNKSVMQRFAFDIEAIRSQKQYYRLLTAGFLHANWQHLLFNMLSLYLFATVDAGTSLSITTYLLLYFSSLIGGYLLAWYRYKNHDSYTAVGASGAISGVIFGMIALIKGLEIGILFIDIGIPGWIYGLLFIGISIYGIAAKRDRISHEAHLGGAITGLILAITLVPTALTQNYIAISLLLIPSMIFIGIMRIKPDFLAFKKVITEKPEGLLTIDDRYNSSKIDKEKEINALLDKISQQGLHKLSKEERQRLEELSK